MTWQVSCGHFWSYFLKIHSHISKGKGQQVIEHSSFPLEFQLPDGKDILQTAQTRYQLKIQYTCLCRHLCHEWSTLLISYLWYGHILTLPSFFLKALCTRLLILDFNTLCGIEGVKYWKIKCLDWCSCMDRSSWSNDDNKLVEFFRIHMLLTPLRLVLVLQYLTNPSFMVFRSLVRRHNRSFVVHLLEPAINLCL